MPLRLSGFGPAIAQSGMLAGQMAEPARLPGERLECRAGSVAVVRDGLSWWC